MVGEMPVAVSNLNRPAFYVVTSRLFEALIKEVVNRDLDELVRRRGWSSRIGRSRLILNSVER